MNNLTPINKEFKSILEKRGMLSNDMGSEISESWARCITNGLDPFKGPKKSVVSSQQLGQIRDEKEDLRKIVIPELELLYSQVAGTNFMVAFSDNEGLVLDTIYDKSCLQTDVGKSEPISLNNIPLFSNMDLNSLLIGVKLFILLTLNFLR